MPIAFCMAYEAGLTDHVFVARHTALTPGQFTYQAPSLSSSPASERQALRSECDRKRLSVDVAVLSRIDGRGRRGGRRVGVDDGPRGRRGGNDGRGRRGRLNSPFLLDAARTQRRDEGDGYDRQVLHGETPGLV